LAIKHFLQCTICEKEGSFCLMYTFSWISISLIFEIESIFLPRLSLQEEQYLISEVEKSVHTIILQSHQEEHALCLYHFSTTRGVQTFSILLCLIFETEKRLIVFQTRKYRIRQQHIDW
jgi:hypothetical protein